MDDDNYLDRFLEFRRAAERKAAMLPEVLHTMSPRELLHTMHELQVHQIELEMQNDNLRVVCAQLDEARERYIELYDLAPVGYFTLSEKGLILEANLTAATMLGVNRRELIKKPISQFILPTDQDVYYLHRKRLFDTGKPQRCELRMLKSDGSVFWGGLDATAMQDAEGAPVCRVSLNDITERKLHEEEREMTDRLILMINTPGDFQTCMASLTDALKNWSGCEAVGIRLRSGNDFPYYETRGFPPDFIRAETNLCSVGPDGKVLVDENGQPVLDCICGFVLSGRADPDKPYFTVQGSFWTNSTTALLTGMSDLERQAHLRHRCTRSGYESLALIPLRANSQIFGLLQFNDYQPNRFTSQLISHFEHMADSLAIVLSGRQVQAALEASEKSYQKLAQHQEAVREEECTRIARELHDDLGQILTTIKIDLMALDHESVGSGVAKKTGTIQQLVGEGIQSVHSLCRQLRPGALDDLGLEEALIGLLDDWRRCSSLKFNLSVDIDDAALSDEIRTAVFRTVQESLTNIAKHACASKVDINLVADSQKLGFSICDDGCGVDEGAESKSTGFGLIGMRERIAVLGGEFRIKSSSDKGTRIEGTIPLLPRIAFA